MKTLTTYPLVGLNLVGVDDTDGRALEYSDITRTLLNELLIEKYKLNMCHTLFENIDYPLVGLDLVSVDDADGHDLERSDNTVTDPDRFLVKIHIKDLPHLI